jgi:hypothetical protein
MKQLLERLYNWELWPFKMRYLNITPVWLWHCLRCGSPWFFTSSNPTLTFGGFEGEGKKEMYDLLPLESYPKTIYINPEEKSENVLKKVAEHNFTYPFCVKPDVGMKGLLFRKIDKEEQLVQYHQQLPIVYIIQELVDYPLEVSVFYYRLPYNEKGVISGFIQKELMEVKGDGKKSLLQLIQDHPIAKHREEEMRKKHEDSLSFIIPADERYILTYAANLSRGARFVNLEHLIDDSLHQMFDALSHKGQFYYGRYDIKCTSIEDLKKGKNYSILEFNGSGAEPNHVYHRGLTLFQAQKVFLHHWDVLVKIAQYNHKQGIQYWPYKKGLLFLKEASNHFKQLEKWDKEILV